MKGNLLGVWLAVGFCACAFLPLGCGDDAAGGGDTGETAQEPRIFNPTTGNEGGANTGAIPDTQTALSGDASEPLDSLLADGVADGNADTNTETEDVSSAAADATEDVETGPVLTPCDDKIPCTIDTYLSDNGKCEGGKFICGDCAGSGCNFDSDCAPFNDDNPCNGVLKCNQGHCVVDSESVVSCEGLESEDPNKRIRCNPSNGLCEPEPLPNGAACDDGNPCTLYDVMFGGQCAGTDVCSPCEGLGDGTACDDGNPCTNQTLCTGGRCVGTNVCECLYAKDCVGLEDGNACNGRMTCIAGACTVNPNTVVHCQRACPDDTCYQGDCLEAQGICIGKLLPGCDDNQ